MTKVESGPTRVLARYAASLRFDEIPAAVTSQLKLHLLDAAGAALHGATMPWTRVIRDLLLEWGGREEAVVWNSDIRLATPHAAFANTVATHGFELDDRRIASYMHPASATLPAGLAVAEASGGVSGRDLLTAIAAGYEVGLRIGRCVGPDAFERGFYVPGLCGSFAAATTAACLWRLNEEQIASAFALTATQASGLYTPTMMKRLNIGRGTYNGVLGVELVRRGFSGVLDVFERDVGGFCEAYAPDADPSLLTSGLGEEFEISKVELKPYVSSRPNHTAIDCVLDLKRQHPDLDPNYVKRVEIEIGTVNYRYGAGFDVRDVPGALMSVAYCAAVALLDGDAFLEQFTEARVADPALQQLLARTVVTLNPAFDALGAEKRDNTIVRFLLQDGRKLERERWHARGHPAQPLSEADVISKFRRLLDGRVEPARMRALESTFADLDALPDVTPLVRLLAK